MGSQVWIMLYIYALWGAQEPQTRRNCLREHPREEETRDNDLEAVSHWPPRLSSPVLGFGHGHNSDWLWLQLFLRVMGKVLRSHGRALLE